jgi:NADPH-dependent F420 reductase
MPELSPLAILGGTGPQGSGLALRWARAGHGVTIGSRNAAKSAQAADDLNRRLDSGNIAGASNEAAADSAGIIILAVPYAAQRSVADSVRAQLQGKILIDVTVPLVPPKVGTVHLPATGSAVVALQASLGEGVRVVSAFQNISAHHLHDLDHGIDCDVLICGDDKAACETVIVLAQAAGMRGWHAGPLANSAAAEALTSVLITLNRRYRIAGSGIRITGAPAAAP